MHFLTAIRHTRPVLAMLALLLCGCGTLPREAADAPTVARVWPPPPETPRIAFERIVTGPRDLGLRPPVWRRAANFLTGSERGEETFVRPQGVAVDEFGNLCVADPGAGAVIVFDLQAQRCLRWTSSGRRAFAVPVGIARRGGITYVADSGLGAVLGVDDRGHEVLVLTNGLQRPAGIAVTSNRLIVADAAAHRILLFTLAGQPVGQFGALGTGPGNFNAPAYVATAPGDRIVVCDTLNFRVQTLSAAGVPIGSVGGQGDGMGRLSRPKGVAVDGAGRLFAVDALFDNVQVFDGASRFLMHWGEAGAEPGEFWLPAGIALDAAGRLFVADSYNRRVQIFRYVGPPR